jgi:predicted PurR-regulated permease PerM
MNIEYPLLSAIILGLFDFVPFIGPILATIIIVIINISNDITHAGVLLLACLVLQYVQNIFGPYIRSKFLKIDPIVTLFFIAIFGKFGGALGVFVAIPLSTTIVEFLKDLSNQKIYDERFNKLL